MFKKISGNYLVFISFILYIVSLFLTAAMAKNGEIVTGLYLLLFGWAGIIGGVIAWYANPLYVISIILLLFKKHKVALILLVISVVIALQSFIGIPMQNFYNSGSPSTGFYVWELSFIILSIHALKMFLEEKNTTLSDFASTYRYWLILGIFICGLVLFLFRGEFPWFLFGQ